MPTLNKRTPNMNKQPPSFIMLSMVLCQLYQLPLVIKTKIYKMCIDSHMVEWVQEYQNNLKPTISFLNMSMPFRAPGWSILENIIQFCGEISPLKICIPCHKMNVRSDACLSCFNDDLNDNKIQDFYIDINKLPYETYIQIIHQLRYYDSDNIFWVGKKCRCLCCDTIRLHSLPYTSENKVLWEKSKQYGGNHFTKELMDKTYSRTTYDPLINEWKTETISQVKTREDVESKHFYKCIRNMINSLLNSEKINRNIKYSIYLHGRNTKYMRNAKFNHKGKHDININENNIYIS